MGKHRAEQQIEIAASPQACFDAIVDYESFPSWQRAVKSVEVLTRDDEGRGEEVAFVVDAKVKSLSYRLRYGYEPPHRIVWDYVGGDVRDIDGEYLLEPSGSGTLAVYRVGLDPGVWVPGAVMRVVNEIVMRGSVEDLKRRVESLD